MRKVADTKLAKLKCSEVTSDRQVEFAKSLDVLLQTRSNYLSPCVADLRRRRDCLAMPGSLWGQQRRPMAEPPFSTILVTSRAQF